MHPKRIYRHAGKAPRACAQVGRSAAACALAVLLGTLAMVPCTAPGEGARPSQRNPSPYDALPRDSATLPREHRYHALRVIDAETGRGVPLVELRATSEAAWWTDSAGVVALDEPGWFGRSVFLHVRSPGYAHPKDGFGYAGVRFTPERGGSTTVRLQRLNVAERLYRITGADIYRDSVLLGLPTPIREPLLNAGVTGQDSVVATPYRGRLYWCWGDTNLLRYPLGNFGATGATSDLPGRGGLPPSQGIDFRYFTGSDGFVRPMCPEPSNGMRWLEGLLVVPDATGADRLVARMANHRDLAYAHDVHLMRWSDEKGHFESIRRWDIHAGYRIAQPFFARTGGRVYAYLHPELRVPATVEALADLGRYEAFTCVAGDGRWLGADTQVARDAAGRPHYRWVAGGDMLHGERLSQLVRTGKLAEGEAWMRLRDVETGARVPARWLESVAWNSWRRCWIGFFASKPGEVWYSEAASPVGPWVQARRVAEHGDTNFYNIAHHSFFDEEGGRRVYFEGTYTVAFSAAKAPTPRYDYNQIMYRLDLSDPRLRFPQGTEPALDPVEPVADARGGPVR